ncbi:MAG: hypothetical protein V1928_03905 [Parcubacteria group bacterium]
MKIKLANKEIFNMPDWEDCTWKRDVCGKDECKICGKIKKQRAAHIAAGRDPDVIESMMMDVEEDFKKTIGLIRKAAKREGIDLSDIKDNDIDVLDSWPLAEEFPLAEKVKDWSDGVRKMFMIPVGEDDSWFEAEAAKDVLYYKSTFEVKVVRQLSCRLELERGDEYVDADYLYTKYVLEYIIDKLKSGMSWIMKNVENKSAEAMVSLAKLQDLEKQVEKLNGFYDGQDVGLIKS